MVIFLLVVMPLIGICIFKRRKKIKVKVVSICPHCQTQIGLEKVRNYTCAGCGTVNFDAIVHCTSCGAER